jgi:quinol monooxygenase YgiN
MSHVVVVCTMLGQRTGLQKGGNGSKWASSHSEWRIGWRRCPFRYAGAVGDPGKTQLIGTKFRCAVGLCGARRMFDGKRAFSGQMQVSNVGGEEVTTIEGFSPDSSLSMRRMLPSGVSNSARGERMRQIFQLGLAMAILAPMLAGPVRAQGDAVYLATYIDVLPNAVVSGVALLKRYRDASRKERGNLRFDVLHEIARPDRFAILEVWQDKAALDGHDKAVSTLRFRDELKEVQSAPYDERVGSGTYVEPLVSKSRADTIYVLTHVDVTPDHLDDCLALLKTMSEDTSMDHGNIGYEVLQQATRPNHFTVVEEWTSRKALDFHIIAAHTRAFRQRLAPMAGALYDQRFYQELG